MNVVIWTADLVQMICLQCEVLKSWTSCMLPALTPAAVTAVGTLVGTEAGDKLACLQDVHGCWWLPASLAAHFWLAALASPSLLLLVEAPG